MGQRNFEVEAIWDENAGVWYAKSDISGLHIEAETLPEFQDLVRDFAAELIVSNHYGDKEIDRADLASLIPAIFWKTNDGSQQPC